MMGKGMCRFEAYRAERHAEEAKNGDAGGVPWWEEIGVPEAQAKRALVTGVCVMVIGALIVALLILLATGTIEATPLSEVQR